jgi:hypothetical protein
MAMRSFYCLLILNSAVMTSPIWTTHPAIFREHRAVYLILCLALPVANYATTRNLARQRGAAYLEIGLWAAWVGGPFVTAMFVLEMILAIHNRDFGRANTALGPLTLVAYAWMKVRESEKEGWGKIDPKGPMTLTEALRS